VLVPATEIASELGNHSRAAIWVALGAYVEKSGVLPLESVSRIAKAFPGKKESLHRAMNKDAIMRGVEWARAGSLAKADTCLRTKQFKGVR